MYRTALILLLASVLLTACKPDPMAQAAAIRPVIIEAVQPVAAARTASYSGQVHARFETMLSFRIAGKVTERMAGTGDRVEAGQPLARLAAEDMRLAAQAAAAELAAAQEQYALAQSQYQRAAALHKRNALSQSAYDQRKTQLQVAAAQLERAENHHAMQQNRLAYTQLHADHAGVITAVHVESGQVVAAGQPAFGFARAGERELRIAVPESRIDAVTTGTPVEITFWALPGVRVPGRVREVAADADPRSGTYRVFVTLLEQPDALRLGMTATAHFRHQTGKQVIRLPLTSLYHADDKPAVWVVDPAANTVSLQPVTVLRYETDAVVLAAGQELKAGARVVTKGVSKLHAGQRVKPMDSFFAHGSANTEDG